MKKIGKGCLVVVVAFILLSIIVGLFSDSEETNTITSDSNFNTKISADSLLTLSKLDLKKEKYRDAFYRINEIEETKKDSLLKGFEEHKKNVVSKIQKKIQALERKTKNIGTIRKKYDEFNKITWYTPSSGIGYGNKIYLYFGLHDNGSVYNPRFVLRYYGEDWIFWDKAKFLIDGNTYDYYPDSKPERDNNSKVFETSDENLTTNIKSIILSIINSKTSKYRLLGKYRYDRKITNRQKNDLKKVLELHSNFNEMRSLISFCDSNGIKL